MKPRTERRHPMENITFDDFRKIELKVAEIKACEDIEGADKLYRLIVDAGEERQIVAGIKQHYTKEGLIGKKIVVANLEPRKLRGNLSQGMLLAASNQDKTSVVLVTLDRDIPNGSDVS
jgi:methionyl-tRNA synthetase